MQKGEEAAEVEAKRKEIEAKKMAQAAKKNMFYKVTVMVRGSDALPIVCWGIPTLPTVHFKHLWQE